MRNQNSLSIVQKQLNPGRVMRKILKDTEQQNVKQDSHDLDIKFSEDEHSGESDDSENEN
jgi:hypothetical protein